MIYLSKLILMKQLVTCLLILAFLVVCKLSAYAQVCGTSGLDGPFDIGGQINTYYPPESNTTLTTGATTVNLVAVPADVAFGGGTACDRSCTGANCFNTYSASNKSIAVGDLLLIIQMQDATINSSNTASYGAGSAISGLDGLGATGYISLGNTGLFEYVVATNEVPLTGGLLTFRGAGVGGGMVNSYYNYDPTTTQGKRAFQVIRVPQYSNVRLVAKIYAPPFNGNVGGIIAFDVSGIMDFNVQAIDASERGFRGGFVNSHNSRGTDDDLTYVTVSTNTAYNSSGKGEGVAGTPISVWDGFKQIVNNVEGLPGGAFGRGAPGNAGGGGNSHNSGGGGGGNGGYGGVGGKGWTSSSISCGRPGSASYQGGNISTSRLIMGGGGGAGEVNNANCGADGGPGGGIIVINVGSIKGSGSIFSNGADGLSIKPLPDGGGGGGAGGTIFLRVSDLSSKASLTITAKGGKGADAYTNQTGNITVMGPGLCTGSGGGGGGGIILYTASNNIINTDVSPGAPGIYYRSDNSGSTWVFTQDEPGVRHGEQGGTAGMTTTLDNLPLYLQGGGPTCFPELSTIMSEASHGATLLPGSLLTYSITVSNKQGVGNAAGVLVDISLPVGITYQSMTVTYLGGSNGDVAALVTQNQGTAGIPRFGNFIIAPGGSIVLTLIAKVDCNAGAGTYNAHTQAYYLDPTRILANPKGHISPNPIIFNPQPIFNKLPLVNYAAGALVIGSNFNGLGSTAENVVINNLAVTSNSPVYIGNALQLEAIVPSTATTYTWTTPSGQQLKSKNIAFDSASESMRGTYILTVSVDNCLLTMSTYINIRGKLIIPNVFTPNGDGVEDTWKITGLEDYPADRTVQIFNNWGTLIYSSVGYNEPWDGQGLPVATYYYVIDLKDNGKTPLIAGYVAVVR